MKRTKWEIPFRLKKNSLSWTCKAKATYVAVREWRPALRLRWPLQMHPRSSFTWQGAEKPGAGGLKYRCGKREIQLHTLMRSKRSWKPQKKSTDDRKSGKWGRDIFVRNQILDVLNSSSGSNAAINDELNLTFVYQCQWYRISACLHGGSTFSNLTWSNIAWC